MAKATILIVEDNPDISQPLADAFRFADFNTLQAYNAVARAPIRQRTPAGSHPDGHPAPRPGWPLGGATLKSDPAVRDIPIVAMTAYDVVGDQARAISRHCVGHAQKPVRPRDLVTLISAVLKLKSERNPRPPKDGAARTPRK